MALSAGSREGLRHLRGRRGDVRLLRAPRHRLPAPRARPERAAHQPQVTPTQQPYNKAVGAVHYSVYSTFNTFQS